MSGWDAAKRRLYEAFGHVARPERVIGCPHCVDPGEELCILAGPVRSVEAESLARYAAKALTTWGGVTEFRYFLPRLLECAAEDAFTYPDPEIVFGKLASGDWQTWPIDERDAIAGFLREWWHETLRNYPARPPIDTVLCALAATGMDLATCLSTWSNLDTDPAIQHLHDFVLTGMSGNRMTNAFWNRQSPAYQQVHTWLTGGPAAAAVEAAFARQPHEPNLELLAAIEPALHPPR
ncbi:hypothetical protein [Nonomuraea sediminis]|uniref:hypothetical protein n=1 Tax=Nonomuraea sediminis TaxID=2835864 RepID=UPI001BDC5A2F|nr:hypothetical protein [Nonomuraea sediminis]